MRDVHEQAHVRVVELDDLVDRRAGLGRAGRLRTLDLFEQRRGRSRAGSAAHARAAARPAWPMGRRTPRAPSWCAISICGRRNANRSSSVRRVPCGDQSSMLAPRMLTRPPAAVRRVAERRGIRLARAPGRSATADPARPRSRPPGRPRRCRPRCRRHPGRRAIISGVQLKALAAEHPARGQRRRPCAVASASARAARSPRAACGASSTSDRSARNGSVSGPSGPTCR